MPIEPGYPPAPGLMSGSSQTDVIRPLASNRLPADPGLAYLRDGRLVDGAGNVVEGMLTQPERTVSFTLQSSDSGTVIPVTGNLLVTLDLTSELAEPVEIRRYNAGALQISVVGASLLNPATGSAWGALSVSNKLASIIICPGSMAGEYLAVKVGA